MKLYIAVVSNRAHAPQFTGSLYALTQHLTYQGKNYGVEMHAVSIGTGHSCLSRGRQQALNFATAQGFTHLLFLDDDMVFAPNVAQLMIQREVPAIGANYVMKTVELRPVARDAKGGRISSTGKTGIEEAPRLGMGIFLIDLNAIKNIPAPHFEVNWSAEKNDYISEDHYFCDKLEANGIKIYVDHDASQGVGHVGDYIYTMPK
jgi:hypothetical protein